VSAREQGVSARVISIGVLDAHPLWDERAPVRTGHATTTLITSGDARILVDPGLPAQILAARLGERANLAPADITHVFLTSFRPDARRALPAFDGAQWLIAEAEREAVGVPLVTRLQDAGSSGDEELAKTLKVEVALLQRCNAAPDRIAPGVDLFPLHGVTPGLTGLLLPQPRMTTLICGDAVPTVEHLERGIVPRWAADAEAAKESFLEALEIADVLVLGRDNLAVNPGKRPF
jgi:glyoxylase-like metal-dependent hydrolase (beta-lactamase superfamily II)